MILNHVAGPNIVKKETGQVIFSASFSAKRLDPMNTAFRTSDSESHSSPEVSGGGVSVALKEWAIAIQALLSGDQILLLRKGGIREGKPRFQIPQRQVLLYPTYEHQKPELLKPTDAEQVEPVPSGWHPEQVEIRAWAEITDVIEIDQAAQVEALLPLHCWNERFVAERLKWKPQVPLNLLLLRVYKLAEATVLDYRPEFGGCKSWIDWPETISIQDSCPVLDDETYEVRRMQHRQLQNVT